MVKCDGLKLIGFVVPDSIFMLRSWLSAVEIVQLFHCRAVNQTHDGRSGFYWQATWTQERVRYPARAVEDTDPEEPRDVIDWRPDKTGKG
ncbi:hypothetical protein R3I93_020853 [Phoxinus phoxinus]|uniref:Uncharacterized protein n=1 Tax=Phoxinus phoxinus TaxID=58324 RepID=A0AAN9GS86_9TELE